MRRVAATIFGTLLVLVGSFALVTGIVVLSVFGMDGRSDAGAVRAVVPSSALVVDPLRADAGLPQSVNLSTLSLSADAMQGTEIFVGVGPEQDVLAYLSGAPYDIARGIDGRSQNLDQITVAGTGKPSPPTAQSFWTQQATGTAAQSLVISLTGSEELVVVMNADSSAPVDVRLAVGVEAAWIGPAGIAAVTGGAALLVVGLWLLLFPRRRARSAQQGQHDAVGPQDTGATRPPSAWGQPIAPSDRLAEGTQQRGSPHNVVDLRAVDVVSSPTSEGGRGERVLATSSVGRRPDGPEGPPREPGE